MIASGRLAGLADKGSGRTAKAAFVVGEDHQRQGLAGRLLKQLAAIARQRQFVALTAEVLAENKTMLAVFARSGLPLRKRCDGGVAHVTLEFREGAPRAPGFR